MEQEKLYRHELKFEIPYADYAAMRRRLAKIMRSDPHTDDTGHYRIRSIYFDKSDDKALREKSTESESARSSGSGTIMTSFPLSR